MNHFQILLADIELREILGEGSYGLVRRGEIPILNNFQLAVKEIKQNEIQNAEYEYQVQSYVSSFCHNILQAYGFVKGTVTLQSKTMVFLEYVDGFDLFRYIKRERMTGAIVRYICHQVGQGLWHMHMLGFCHLDLKHDNVLICNELDENDQRHCVKIIDFGKAAAIQTQQGEELLIAGPRKVANCFTAPEKQFNATFKGDSADVFSFVVLIFTMYLGHYPFVLADDTEDDQFINLQKENTDEFWREDHARYPYYNQNLVTDAFKHLFENGVRKDPANRLSLQQVLTHPWMIRRRASHEETQAELLRRRGLEWFNE